MILTDFLTTESAIKLSEQTNDLVIYNHWANDRLIDWLVSKPSNLLEIEVASSFAGIKNTLLHIWDLERSWFGHLRQQPVKSFRFEGFDGTLEDIIFNIVNQSKLLMEYVSSFSDEELAEECFFSIPYVGDHYVPRYQIIQHIIYHSTYHRGQLTTIGHHVGLHDAPMTDYMFYLLRVKNK